MDIEIIKNELLELQNKVEEMQKAINEGGENYKKLDTEIKALLTKQAIEGANAELEESIKNLKAERIIIQNSLSDNNAIVEGLHQAIADKGVQLHQEEIKVATEQYNLYAKDRKEIDELIENKADELIALFDKLAELDGKQRLVAKIAQIVTGRKIDFIIEDFISHKLRPYHRGLGPILYHLTLTETDSLNKEIEHKE